MPFPSKIVLLGLAAYVGVVSPLAVHVAAWASPHQYRRLSTRAAAAEGTEDELSGPRQEVEHVSGEIADLQAPPPSPPPVPPPPPEGGAADGYDEMMASPAALELLRAFLAAATAMRGFAGSVPDPAATKPDPAATKIVSEWALSKEQVGAAATRCCSLGWRLGRGGDGCRWCCWCCCCCCSCY